MIADVGAAIWLCSVFLLLGCAVYAVNYALLIALHAVRVAFRRAAVVVDAARGVPCACGCGPERHGLTGHACARCRLGCWQYRPVRRATAKAGAR